MILDFDYKPDAWVFWADGYVGPIRELQKSAEQMFGVDAWERRIESDRIGRNRSYASIDWLFGDLLAKVWPDLRRGSPGGDIYAIDLSWSRSGERLSSYPALSAQIGNAPKEEAYYAVIGVLREPPRDFQFYNPGARRLLESAGLEIRELYEDREAFERDVEELLSDQSYVLEPFLAPCFIAESRMKRLGLKANKLSV